ncbi:RNF4 ligase, partial [Nesospiza acunhae]|nr:RNF4 ligase [Nesospiza acunhae]
RKRPGGAVGSRPARKRSRLLPSSAGGTSQTEPRDLEESGEDVIDLTGESSESEVIIISDNESPVVSSEGHTPLHLAFKPHLSRASENSAEPLARNDEEEPIEDDGYVREKVSVKAVISDTCSVPSSAQQRVVIRCPICMEFYSEIMQHGRQLVATLCGHVFCSRCLPVALETSHMCPTCKVAEYPDEYIPIYL